MLFFVVAGIMFRFLGVTSFGPGKVPPVGKKEPSEATRTMQETLLTSYDVKSRSTSREDLLPVKDPDKVNLDRLERDFQDSGNEGSYFLESQDIPPRIRELADQLVDLKNSFDKSTLDSVNSLLKEVPLVDLEADRAEIRPSGDGVSLRINIPVDSVDLKD